MVDLAKEVQNKFADPVYMVTKSDFIEHYKDTYGAKKWTSQAAQALSGSSDKRSKEYKAAIRQFQGERLHQAGPRIAAKFEGAGKNLKPSSYTPKTSSITVTIKGTQTGGSYKRVSGGNTRFVSSGTREREFTKTFTGSDAYQFVNNPNLRDFFKNMGYPDNVIDQLDDDGDYGVTVTSVN